MEEGCEGRTGEETSRSHRDLAGGEGEVSSARFLQAIRGSQQHQENLGGPGGKNRQVTSHKQSPWGDRGAQSRTRSCGERRSWEYYQGS